MASEAAVEHTLEMLGLMFVPGELPRLARKIWATAQEEEDLFKRYAALCLCIRRIEITARKSGLRMPDNRREAMFEAIDCLNEIGKLMREDA